MHSAGKTEAAPAHRWTRVALLTLIATAIGAIAFSAPAGAAVSGDTSFTPPSFTFTSDVLGPNDVPGQKDLTAHSSVLNANFYVAWKWDDVSFSGGNTGDACALFETNTNGDANAALCVTIGGKPATWQSTRVYTCGDTKNDRCTSTYTEVSPIGSKCQVDNAATAQFSPGPNASDSQATCKVDLTDFGSGTTAASMINTCSYPSREPTSAPSDCVLIPGVRETGAIEITKTGDDANCTGTTLPAGCQSAGVKLLSGAQFSVTGTDAPSGAGSMTTDSTGKVCLGGFPTGNSYTVTETGAPTGYQIDDTVLDDPLDPLTQGVQTSKSVTVGAAGTCASGPVGVSFSDSPLSAFKVTFMPPNTGVTLSQIDCTGTSGDEDGGADNTTPPNLDDTEETYSGLTAGTYTCTININP